MSEALGRRWIEEVWNQRRAATVEELLAPDAVMHGLPMDRPGPAGFLQFHGAFLRAFPDMQLEVVHAIEGPRDTSGGLTLALHFRCRLPSRLWDGKEVSFACMSFTRWRRGQIVEAWDVADFHALREQLGGTLPF